MSNATSNVLPFPFAFIGNTFPKHTRLTEVNAGQAFSPAPGAATSGDASPSEMDLSQLHRNTPVVNLMAQVQDWTLHWAGRISCTLRTSIGDIIIHTDRDVLPIEVDNGSWIHAKLLLARNSENWHTLINVVQVFPSEEDSKAAWLPVAATASKSYMNRLRVLLSKFEPSVQAIFMGAMTAPAVQQGFLARVSARDHHETLGGLFQHSVHAAELAHANPNLSKQERDIAALACLLFDLGKATETCVTADATRIEKGLCPHPKTGRLLDSALQGVEGWNPEAVGQLRSLLQVQERTSPQAVTATPSVLQQCVVQAIIQSWQMDQEALPAAGDKKGGQQ